MAEPKLFSVEFQLTEAEIAGLRIKARRELRSVHDQLRYLVQKGCPCDDPRFVSVQAALAECLPFVSGDYGLSD